MPTVRDFLNRRLDDWRWLKDIDDDTVIYNELVNMPVRPQFEYRPYMCQLVCHWIGICRDSFLFFLPLSAGKTKLILDIYNYRLREDGDLRGLVLVPRVANIKTWLDQVEEHTPHLHAIPILGSTEEKRRALFSEADLYIACYTDLQFLMADLQQVSGKKKQKRKPNERMCREVQKRINFVACDEIHKAGNHESLIYRLLKRLTKTARYRYGITATPFSRKVERLWAIFNLIDHGETFGSTLTQFREVFFTKKRNVWSGFFEHKFDDSMKSELHRLMQNRSIRYENHEVKELPPRVPRVEELAMSPKQLEMYRDARKGLVDCGSGAKEELEAAYIRSRQALSGYVEWKDENRKTQGIYLDSDAKLEWLQSFLEDTEEKFVIFYKYTSSAKRITKMLKKEKCKHSWIWSGCKNAVKAYDDFRKKDDIQGMVINLASGDAGLQFEMARYCIFYESPEDPVTREQAEGRVARDGPTATDSTYVIDLVTKKSFEGKLLKSLEEGINFQEEVLSGRIQDWED
ncbi:putative helicase [Vibrio phage vB_VpS_CC6]|nr:putative helicase [Vibrio phage vB_VpS_CC6]